MDRAQTGEISLLFLDALHFVMGCNFPGYIYGRVRRFVKTFSGRRRYYNQFELFREQIDSIIDSTDKVNKGIVDRLMGEKVQLFDDLIAVNENSFKRKQEAA